MSFASEVKKELLSIEDENYLTQKAMLLGIMQGCSSIVFSNDKVLVILKSYILSAIQKALSILKKTYAIEAKVKYSDENNINKLRYYYLEIENFSKEIIEEYYLSPIAELTLSSDILKQQEARHAFVRGMFIARGSINDPRKNCYHLEISCKNNDLALLLKAILNSNDINAKIKIRKNSYVVYVKKSEEISSTLALMKAGSGVFYFEDLRIVRDISNMANRVTNCDIANVRKVTRVANKQLKIIRRLRKLGLFEQMPLRLQTIAIMREEYPYATLEELSQYSSNIFGKNLSKSGISHCFQDLIKYYDDITIKK